MKRRRRLARAIPIPDIKISFRNINHLNPKHPDHDLIRIRQPRRAVIDRKFYACGRNRSRAGIAGLALNKRAHLIRRHDYLQITVGPGTGIDGIRAKILQRAVGPNPGGNFFDLHEYPHRVVIGIVAPGIVPADIEFDLNGIRAGIPGAKLDVGNSEIICCGNRSTAE